MDGFRRPPMATLRANPPGGRPPPVSGGSGAGQRRSAPRSRAWTPPGRPGSYLPANATLSRLPRAPGGRHPAQARAGAEQSFSRGRDIGNGRKVPGPSRFEGTVGAAASRRWAAGGPIEEGDSPWARSHEEEYADELFAVAHRLTESSAAAGDVLQDVFSELPEAMRGFDGKRRIGPWLRTVTARAALKHLRSRRVRREISLASVPRALEGEPSPEGRVLDAIALERALSALPDELRAVVVLKVVEGYSCQWASKMSHFWALKMSHLEGGRPGAERRS